MKSWTDSDRSGLGPGGWGIPDAEHQSLKSFEVTGPVIRIVDRLTQKRVPLEDVILKSYFRKTVVDTLVY